MSALVPHAVSPTQHALTNVVAGAPLAPAAVPVPRLLAVGADALELHHPGVATLHVGGGVEADWLSATHDREGTPVAVKRVLARTGPAVVLLAGGAVAWSWAALLNVVFP